MFRRGTQRKKERDKQKREESGVTEIGDDTFFVAPGRFTGINFEE